MQLIPHVIQGTALIVDKGFNRVYLKVASHEVADMLNLTRLRLLLVLQFYRSYDRILNKYMGPHGVKMDLTLVRLEAAKPCFTAFKSPSTGICTAPCTHIAFPIIFP